MLYEGCTFQEIKAYRELDGQPFDFGEGLIYPSDTMGSEDTYYEMALQEAEEQRDYRQYQSNMKALNCLEGHFYEDCHLCISNQCVFAGNIPRRANAYLRKYYYKKKQFARIDVYRTRRCFMSEYDYVYGYSRTYPNLSAKLDDKGQFYVKKFYKAGRIKWLKKEAKRSVRRTKGSLPKGRSFCKIYDLWWNYD